MSEISGFANKGELDAFVRGYLLGLGEQQLEGQASSGQDEGEISDMDFEEALGAPSGPSADLLTAQSSLQASQLRFGPSGLDQDVLLVGSGQAQQGSEVFPDHQDFPTFVDRFLQQQDLHAQGSSQYLPMPVDGFDVMEFNLDDLAAENPGLLDESCDLALSDAGVVDDAPQEQGDWNGWEAASSEMHQLSYLPSQPQPPPSSAQEHPIPCGREECHICGIYAIPF